MEEKKENKNLFERLTLSVSGGKTCVYTCWAAIRTM